MFLQGATTANFTSQTDDRESQKFHLLNVFCQAGYPPGGPGHPGPPLESLATIVHIFGVETSLFLHRFATVVSIACLVISGTPGEFENHGLATVW